MRFERTHVLRGANVWARCPVLEVEVDLEGTSEDEGFSGRLLAILPALEGRLPDESPSGRCVAQPAGMLLARALCAAALDLQVQAGSDVRVGVVRPCGGGGGFRVVVEYEEEALGLAALEAARRLCLAALAGRLFPLEEELEKLRATAHEVRLGPSTAAIVRAAQQRGIPVRRLNRDSLIQLGHGALQRRSCTAETDRTSAVAEAVAQDKQLTRSLLEAVGVPVPEGRPVADAEDAWLAAQEIGPPVVVKPRDGNHGRGVATNLTTREQVVRAYAAARAEGESVMVERFIPGSDYRVLVVGDRVVAAALREPAQVFGNGRSTIAELIEEVNRDPRRSDGHATVLSRIKLDAVSLAVLAEQNQTPESVPPAGGRVLIRRNGNLSTGGTATDVTDRIHPETASRAVDAARAVGLDVAGVDVVATDIGQPLEAQGGAVVEVNAGPGLRMHLEPSAGQPRPVGEAVVDLLFAPRQTGRIPLAAVTGVNGKTTTTRLLGHLLRAAGNVVGMACTDGLYVAGRRIDTRDCSGPRSARAVLLNPRVTAAVLETARGGILREGLGFDRCDAAVVTNIGRGDHLSLRGVETLEDLARVKRTVVEAVSPGGSAILNASDPLVAAMAGHCPGRVIYFARQASPVVQEHRKRGGRAVLVRGGEVVLAEGPREEALLPLARAPLTHSGRVGFQVENVLAAVGAAWSLGIAWSSVRAALETFTGDASQAPGRFNVLQANGATVIVDYAHNPSALAAVVEALGQLPHRRRTIVFAGCNRRDDDVVEMGAVVGDGFDRVILYHDRGNNDRADGELNALVRTGLARGRRVARTIETASEREAIGAALDAIEPGDVVVLGVEAIEESLALVRARLDGRAASAGPGS
jgi:cyanophycin synthetase